MIRRLKSLGVLAVILLMSLSIEAYLLWPAYRIPLVVILSIQLLYLYLLFELRLGQLGLIACTMLLSVLVGSLALWAFPGGLSSMSNGIANAINYIAGTGIQIVGTTLSTSTVPTGMINVVTDEGAKADGRIVLDAAMTKGASKGSDDTPTSVAYTSNYANETVLQLFQFDQQHTWSVKPAITSVVDIASSAAPHTGLFIGEQTIASAGGTLTAVSGTLAGATGWTTLNIPLVPTGSAVTIGNVTTQTTTGANSTFTINTPAGVGVGDYLLMCSGSNAQGITQTTLTAPAGWSLIAGESPIIDGGGQWGVFCYLKIATNSEPSTYTFLNSAGYNAAGLIDLQGVKQLDGWVMSSATGAFTSADIGKLSCFNDGSDSAPCGHIVGVVSGTQAIVDYPAFVTATTQEARWGTDNCTAFTAAVAAPTTGNAILVPPGMYAMSCSLLFTENKGISLLGETGGGSNAWQYPPPNSITFIPTALLFLTRDLKSGALQYTGVTQAGYLTPVRLEHLTLWSGVAVASAAPHWGNADGIDITNFSHLYIEDVGMWGFGGYGVVLTSTNASLFSNNDSIRDSVIDWNRHGVEINGTYMSADTMENNEIIYNPYGGLYITNNAVSPYVPGTHVGGFTFAGNLMGVDSTSATPACEIYQDKWAEGVTIVNNYDELQGATNGVCLGSSAGSVGGVNVVDNIFVLTGTGNHAVVVGADGTHIDSFSRIQGNISTGSGLTQPCVEVLGGANLTISGNSCSGANGVTDAFTSTVTGTGGTVTGLETLLNGQVTYTAQLKAYNQTSTADTITYPVPFQTTPNVIQSGCSEAGSYPASSTATVLTLPANASMTTESCTVVVQGE